MLLHILLELNFEAKDYFKKMPGTLSYKVLAIIGISIKTLKIYLFREKDVLEVVKIALSNSFRKKETNQLYMQSNLL